LIPALNHCQSLKTDCKIECKKNLNRSRSLLIGSILLNVEVFDLIGSLSGGDDVQEFSQAVLLQVLLCQVLQVSLGEGDAC
jgi:hypothetical protein